MRGLALWLLLLSILTHAAAPAASPLQRGSGSAFRAATTDVSLAPRRDQVATKQVTPRKGRDWHPGGGDTVIGTASWTVPEPLFAAGPIWPPPSSMAAQGGAAAFSARAPPAG